VICAPAQQLSAFGQDGTHPSSITILSGTGLATPTW